MQRSREASTASLIAILIASVIATAGFLSPRTAATRASQPDADVLIVGAGISGLSAALEMARAGARVKVVDMNSVFGGHAVKAGGGVSIVGTPLQESREIKDTPELAYKDFMTWGEDANAEWVRYYVNNSRREIYDWMTEMGVAFNDVQRPDGNSVARFHQTRGGGLSLVSAIYRECLQHSNIAFEWNIKVESLITERGQVVGMKAKNLRTGAVRNLYASAVILATGGFQGNLKMVHDFWPRTLPFPDRFLVGGGEYAQGSGHKLARNTGAVLFNMDHQWNYITGIPDPTNLGTHALNAYNGNSIWVNAQGKRFVREFTDVKESFPAVVNQKPATYWAVFDETTKRDFRVTVAGWSDFKKVQELILHNPKLTKSAATIEELAKLAGMPPSALAETVRRYNEMIGQGEDKEFKRFSRGAGDLTPKIEKPPFYAVQFFPVTRKSMGGVLVDLSCRVLDKRKRPIPGLYAVGELTGFAGINGKAGLEGTFLGPSIVTGRVAGRAVLAELKKKGKPPATLARAATAASVMRVQPKGESCRDCHHIESLAAGQRNGFWHFEKVHRLALERKYDCMQCHAALAPYQPENHRIDPLAQVNNCVFCHSR